MKKSILITSMTMLMMLTIAPVSFASSKPNIVILATGGTIAGSASSDTATTGYKAGAIGIDTLINAVPEAKNYANISGEQLCSIDSKDMTSQIWLKLANRVNTLLAQDNVDGIVITHGTDTLEETAYFLDLTVKSNKPVVLVGAMRPATAISADGPMNLLNAVRVAANKQAVGKGVLVTMNDEINSARDVTKTNTLTTSTFKAPELGVLGYIEDGTPVFYRESTRRNTINSDFSLENVMNLPYVPIIYSHADGDSILIDAAVKAGAQGIIYAGTGNGSVHKTDEEALARAAAAGIIVVRSSRVTNGAVIQSEQSYVDEHFLNGGTLNPQKARILLQLALTKTHDLNKIQTMFNEY
ncbi:type II asparaginase [Pectinatus cerevisiiphilus]|uniref:asparaginase n=1 Tax=Pectinatus cerevisiiphilus TaxID=86956 RepID=A0A4R3K2M1_9FIRM|nr:type II asparaginase [Pectinatus cerevisiiphilus]TCS76703.1 L-asparaginase [Pectinatus cerevisiiphilus]